MPPGPFPLPIFGNLFKLGNKPHISMAELAKTYGPIMTLQLGQLSTVVISSASAARELLHKNDISFSNRTVLDALRAINHHESSVVWLPASAHWRTLRKICNSQVFSIRRVDDREGVRREKVEELLTYIEKCSKAGIAVDIGQAAFLTNLNMLSKTFFSADLGGNSSEFCCEFKDIAQGIIDEAGKQNFADYFPALKKMDLQGIRRRMGSHFEKMIHIFNTIIEQRLQGKRLPRCVHDNDVLDALLGINQENPKDQIERSQIPHLLLDLFSAGTDTTPKTIEWAMAELIKSPEKLKKAQAELRKIIGKGNPIEKLEIARLPYLQAVVKETLRLHPPAPFLVPRKVENDTILCGFTVPKNAQVLVNVWAIGRDSNSWANPNAFEPERFLGIDIDVKGRNFELIPFGAGHRMCPGMAMAMRMLHLMLGSLIHQFDWRLEEGLKPEEMDMEEKVAFTLGKAQALHAIPIPVCN